jgi:hypothetical protein
MAIKDRQKQELVEKQKGGKLICELSVWHNNRAATIGQLDSEY